MGGRLESFSLRLIVRMPNPATSLTTDAAPNPWAVINDYSKTVVTLASALLAATVTFSGQIIGSGLTFWQAIVLFSIWICLLGTIVFGVLAQAFLTRFLRGIDSKANKSLGFSIAALCFLVASSANFVAFAAMRAFSNEHDARSSLEVCSKFLSALPQSNGSAWRITSLTWNEASTSCKIEAADENSKAVCDMSLDNTGQVHEFHEHR
jgi:hypothetical protein